MLGYRTDWGRYMQYSLHAFQTPASSTADNLQDNAGHGHIGSKLKASPARPAAWFPPAAIALAKAAL